MLKAGNVSLVADSTNNAVATQDSFGLSLLGSVKLNPQATDQQTVEAYLAAGSNVTSTGTLSLERHVERQRHRLGQRHPGCLDRPRGRGSQRDRERATRRPRSRGTVKAANLSVTATANAQRPGQCQCHQHHLGRRGQRLAERRRTRAIRLAQLEQLGRAQRQGNAVFQATSNPSTNATASGGGGGAINGSNLASSSTINGNTKAFADNGSTVDLAGNLEFEATSTATGSSTTTVGNGGVFADGGAIAVANVNPVIQAYIGNNVQVKNVTGNIVIQAESIRAEGDASAQTDGGGVGLQRCLERDRQQQSDGQCVYRHRLGRQCRRATSRSRPTLQAQPSGPALGNTFNPATAVSVTNDTITFPSHGLVTGDVVTYNANGSTPIGTPSGPLRNGEFGVIVVDSNVLMLGATFSGAPGQHRRPLQPAGRRRSQPRRDPLRVTG